MQPSILGCLSSVFLASAVVVNIGASDDVKSVVKSYNSDAAKQTLAAVQSGDGRSRVEQILNVVTTTFGRVTAQAKVHTRASPGADSRMHAVTKEVGERSVESVAFNQRTGAAFQITFQQFADSEHKREDVSRGYEIQINERGFPLGYRRRDGREVLTFFTNGLPRTYYVNQASNLWYVLRWDEAGQLLSQGTSGNRSIIGPVGVDAVNLSP